MARVIKKDMEEPGESAKEEHGESRKKEKSEEKTEDKVATGGTKGNRSGGEAGVWHSKRSK